MGSTKGSRTSPSLEDRPVSSPGLPVLADTGWNSTPVRSCRRTLLMSIDVYVQPRFAYLQQKMRAFV